MRTAKRSKPKKRSKFFKGKPKDVSPEAEGLDTEKKTMEQQEEKAYSHCSFTVNYPNQRYLSRHDYYR